MITTPVYGIRVPDGRSKLKDLGTELAQTAYDLEAALVAASIPPVTPAPVMVAASANARDQFWGVPGTAAARTALQNRGATTIRTDKGWTERYFAVYNATTNPTGKPAAGWYPLDPGARFAKLTATAQNVTDSTVVSVGALSLVGAESSEASFVTPGAGSVTFTEAGLYTINEMVALTRAASGRSFLDCQPQGGTNMRGTIATGEDIGSLHRTLRVATPGLIVSFALFKNTGAQHSVNTILEIAKIG